jgi:hypothetical protein
MAERILDFLTVLAPFLVIIAVPIASYMGSKLGKKDSHKAWAKVLNRQGVESALLFETLDATLCVNELMVDALHAKGVLNGNATEIKASICQSKKNLKDYAYKQREEGLFIRSVK